jgi:hypothetical protein
MDQWLLEQHHTGRRKQFDACVIDHANENGFVHLVREMELVQTAKDKGRSKVRVNSQQATDEDVDSHHDMDCTLVSLNTNITTAALDIPAELNENGSFVTPGWSFEPAKAAPAAPPAAAAATAAAAPPAVTRAASAAVTPTVTPAASAGLISDDIQSVLFMLLAFEFLHISAIPAKLLDLICTSSEAKY